MGFRYRRLIGSKDFKLNVSKKGLSSLSFKATRGVTLNTRRGLTMGIPGTGMSYNVRKKRSKKQPSEIPEEDVVLSTAKAKPGQEPKPKNHWLLKKTTPLVFLIFLSVLIPPLQTICEALFALVVLWPFGKVIFKAIKSVACLSIKAKG